MAASIEQVKNQIYFTGGPTSGVNLYRSYQDGTSSAAYRVKLDRPTDNRVTVTATADAIGTSRLAEQKDEQYLTTLTVLDKTMDTTLLKPGMVAAFNGFGSFIDTILAQIVRVEYAPSEVRLSFGMLQTRLSDEVENATRSLIAQQTLANPTSPS